MAVIEIWKDRYFLTYSDEILGRVVITTPTV